MKKRKKKVTTAKRKARKLGGRAGKPAAKRRRAKTPRKRRPVVRAKSTRPSRRSRPTAIAKRVLSAKPVRVAAERARPRLKPVSRRAQKLRAMLEAKGAEIAEKIKRARAESLDADRTSFAEVGDLVSASVEKEKAFESGEAGVNAMREIATALEKLKEGTYGICERCGKPIGVKRLEAMPSARLCVKCKAKEEAVGKVVTPPADDTFED